MPKSKSLFKRVVGDWSDFKRGTKMGSAVREKPFKWVEKQAAKMGSTRAEQALKKFKHRAKLALLAIIAIWVPVSLCVFGMSYFSVAVSSVSILFMWLMLYISISRSAKRKGDKN